MTPDAGIHVEITFCIQRHAFVIPKIEWHGRHGFGDNQFPKLIPYRLGFLIESLHIGAKGRALHLARVDRQYARTPDKGGTKIGASTKRLQRQILIDVFINPMKPINGQG